MIRFFRHFELFSTNSLLCHQILDWINVPILQAVDLQKLILAHNDIEVLREDLKNLACLVVLNVSHNKLSELPAAIGE